MTEGPEPSGPRTRARLHHAPLITGIPTLETERLVLRALREDDLAPLEHLNSNPVFRRFLGRLLDRADTWRQIAVHLGHWHLRGYGHWAVEERSGGRFIGHIGLWLPEGWPDLEVGWALDPAFWGRGLATEGGGAALGYAHRVLKVPDVVSLIDPANAASIGVALKLGGRFERTLQVQGRQAALYRYPRPGSP